MVVVALLLVLASPYCILAQNPNTPFGEQSHDYQGTMTGEYVSLDLDIEDNLIDLSDVSYEHDEDTLLLFSQVSIILENRIEIPSGQIQIISEDGLKLVRPDFHLIFNDTESSDMIISVRNMDMVEINMVIAPGVAWEAPMRDSVTLIISQDLRLNIRWSEESVFRVEKVGDIVSVSFILQNRGFVKTDITHVPPVIEDGIPEISIDEHGSIKRDLPDDVSVERRNVAKGDIEFSISTYNPGDRIIKLNISREFMGSEIKDLSNIRVQVDGFELGYLGSRRFYNTEDHGYYVTVVDGETQLLMRINMTETEQEVRVYEVSQDMESTTVEPLATGGLLGLVIGIIVVITATTALVYRKRT